jgi:hypothetical protein
VEGCGAEGVCVVVGCVCVGGFGVVLVVVEEGTELSDPIGAKGFGLPSFPSGVRTTFESCSVVKAASAKILSSSFILFTLSKIAKKSLFANVSELELLVVVTTFAPLLVVETKLSSLGDDLMKKI